MRLEQQTFLEAKRMLANALRFDSKGGKGHRGRPLPPTDALRHWARVLKDSAQSKPLRHWIEAVRARNRAEARGADALELEALVSEVQLKQAAYEAYKGVRPEHFLSEEAHVDVLHKKPNFVRVTYVNPVLVTHHFNMVFRDSTHPNRIARELVPTLKALHPDIGITTTLLYGGYARGIGAVNDEWQHPLDKLLVSDGEPDEGKGRIHPGYLYDDDQLKPEQQTAPYWPPADPPTLGEAHERAGGESDASDSDGSN